MSLQTKYEARGLGEFSGNKSTIESLKSVLKRGEEDIPHSFLFTGPTGCGKTTLARIIRKRLGISETDYKEYDVANTRGIDTIRVIRENMGYSPMDGKRKMYLLDECHQVTGPAQEALLKALLEPPSHVFFALCTTEPEKLKPTLLRRPHHCELKPLIRSEMTILLKRVLEKEGFNIAEYPKEILKKVCDISYGSAGQALKYLDGIIDMEGMQEALDALDELSFRSEEVIKISQILLEPNSKGYNKFKQLQPILLTLKSEPETIRYAIMNYMNKVMLGNGASDGVAETMTCFMEPFYSSGRAGLTYACWLACKASVDEIPF